MEYISTCPHCGLYIVIDQINCGIFRHGWYKNGEQIPPHTPKNICDELVERNEILGCGRPFSFAPETGAVVCDYI